MDILIIGGSRFVGPLLIKLLLEKKHNLTVFNRGTIKTDYGKNVNFIQGDRTKGISINKKFDVVIDTCAYKGEDTKRALYELNFDFFIHFSTAAAYRKSEAFPLKENSPLGDWPLWGEYNKGKVECEKILHKSGKKYAVIRPVYLLGPSNYVDRENFIYSRINNGKKIIIPGNGQAVFQFAFSYDIAKILAFLAEEKIEGAFNCACDEIITLKGLVDYMAGLVGKTAIIEYDPATDGDNFTEEEFPFANANFICSNNKIKNLGITFTPLFEGLKNDYESYYKKLLST